MKLSNFFLPLLKETPSEAKIASHRLMLRAGMIRQQNSGIYVWLPLGLKVLKKIEKIVRQNLEEAGLLEILMPCVQPANLWQESGRYESYGKEMLRFLDRHESELLFGPTNEEIVTDIARKNIFSYKDLPKNFYQIQWKFRDEIRPRFGVMRGREFLMKDAYSFDIDTDSAKKTYETMFRTYFKIFQNLGLEAVAVKADNGAIGGDLSHEFHVLADTGESEIFYEKSYVNVLRNALEEKNIDFTKINQLYSAADEMHDVAKCPVNVEDIESQRGIEVGHIFNFGMKYSESMNLQIMGNDGKLFHPNMGSYGIGVSRLVGAIIEANFDENGIKWPKEVAPFDLAIICLKVNDDESFKLASDIYEKAKEEKLDVLLDDSKDSIGAKFAAHDLIGTPHQIIVGPKLLKQGVVELKTRENGNSVEIKIEELLKGQLVEFLG